MDLTRTLLTALLATLLTACNGGLFASPTPTPTPVSEATPTSPPPSMQTLEACGFTIVHPSGFVPDGPSSQVMFQADADPAVWALIQLRHRQPSEAGLTLPFLALHLQSLYFPEMNDLYFDQIMATDVLSETVKGVQQDITQGGLHTRLITLLRPDSLLGDQIPSDVIYEVVFQTPDAVWFAWVNLFEAMMGTFHPRDCGGV